MKHSIYKTCTFIASTEDDRDNFYDQYCEIKGEWKLYHDGGDYIIKQNGDYYTINDCGVIALYKNNQPNVD